MFKNIICFPHRLGQLKKGVDKAPSLFVNYLKKHKIDINLKNVECNNKPRFFFFNIRNLYKTNTEIDESKFRLNIGGDHSMSIATVAYTLNKYPDCKVIWVDAHADINTYEESTTKNIHGMPLAYLTGIDENINFDFIQNKLPFNNLLYIGLRSIDHFEKKVIDKYNIQCISSEDINNNIEKSFEKIDSFLENKPFHLSFDVDGIDPSTVIYTGTRVNNGINEKSGIQLINYLVQKKTLKNMDLTEMNPYIYDSLNITNINKLFSFIKKCLSFSEK